MSRVVRFPAASAEQRFRHELNTAIAILVRHAKSEITEDLLVAIEDLADDLIKAVDGFRMEGLL
jgi:hypothetical protein